MHKPNWWGVTTANRSLTRLSCRNTEEMWFDMMMSYGDLGPFLSIFSLISLVLYFVTSSDSGSLVIDCLASNGHPNPPRLQVFHQEISCGAHNPVKNHMCSYHIC